MALEIKKMTTLVGNLKIGEEIAKTYNVNIDENGVSTVSEWVQNPTLYSSNRLEMRKQEAAFREKRYEIEDAILAELASAEA
ncbi:hypothetical protein [Streptococcus suis]|uniref:hypothetical protein n=1 Tax=Streptococcus suis TaxID=1307 RepID=UPI000CF734A8|nr:hypothetical protein [Streptococcus suis]